MSDQAQAHPEMPKKGDTQPPAEAAAETTAEQAVGQAAAESGGGQSAIKVAPIDTGSLESGEKSMLAMMRQREDGEQWVAKATALADDICPEGVLTDEGNAKLLAFVRDDLQALGDTANTVIGNRRMQDAGPINQLFSSVSDLKGELKIEEINAKEPWTTKLPFGMGKRFVPIIAFAERYQRIKPKIDGKEKTLGDMIAERIEGQAQIEALKAAILSGFLNIEVAIAAGEIVLQRAMEAWEERRKALEGSEDLVALQQLKDDRLQITNLDNRLMRLQVARMDGVIDLASLDQVADVQRQLKATLEDLKDITINQIRKGVAIALNIHDARQAAALAGGVAELNAALRQANVDALGMAQEEVHKAATAGAREVEELKKVFATFDAVLKRGNELVHENERLNAQARKDLHGLEGDFQEAILSNLQDLTKPAA